MEWILSYCMEFIQCVKLNWTLCKHCYYIGVLLTLHTLLTSLFRFLSISLTHGKFILEMATTSNATGYFESWS